LSEVARFLSELTQWLVIEFVPKKDKQAQRLLVTREDIFTEYNQEGFETVFQQFFDIEKKEEIDGTQRTLYMMKRR